MECPKCKTMAPQSWEPFEGIGFKSDWDKKRADWWEKRLENMGCDECPHQFKA